MGSFRRLIFLLGGATIPFFPFFFLSVDTTDSSTHSMRGFYTAIWDPGQAQPQVIGVIYVDDQIATQYNSSTRQILPQVDWMKTVDKDIPHFWEWNTQRAQRHELRLKRGLQNLKKWFNQSTGFLIWQEMFGCQVSKDGHKEGYDQFGYNGRDFISFDKDTLTWTAAHLEAQRIKRRLGGNLDLMRYLKFYLEEECPEYLLKFVEYGKESLLRREPPVVTVTRKVGYDGLETLLCRAHGFHPKDIDANWKKDGEVWEQDTFRSGVIPNADGTYHTWVSIEVDPKDRGRYRCHVEHDGLQQPAVLAWEEHDFVNILNTISDFVGPLIGGIFGAVVVLLLVAAGIILYNKMSKETPTEEAEVNAPFPL